MHTRKFFMVSRRSRHPHGIGLLEVLISMFILLFGLVGVASLFPVGKYHAAQALRYDQAAAIGQRAFEEVRVRGLLQPQRWNLQNETQFMAAYPTNWHTKPVMFDPIAVAAAAPNSNWVRIQTATTAGVYTNLLQRVTLRGPGGDNITTATAEQLCRVDEDLAFEYPPVRTTPAIQRINSIEREYQGNYSWAFTAVPCLNMGEGFYTVSVVVFRNRQVANEWSASNASAGGSVSRGVGEARLRLPGTPEQTRNIKIGDWMLLSVPSRPADNWYRWYKVISIGLSSPTLTNVQVQGPMVAGSYDNISGNGNVIKVTIFGSAVAVYEQVMKVDSDVEWAID